MSLCRWTTAVAALALIAGSAVAQVTDTTTGSKPAVPVEQPAAPVLPQAPPPPVHVSPVPEPGSIVLLSAAAAGWVTYWRRKWRAAPNGDTPTPPS